MYISAINYNNSFRGMSKNIKINDPDYDLYEVDFSKMADSIDKMPEKNSTSPVKFFLTTAAISIASFVAARKATMIALKGMDGKFPLFNSLDVAGKFINQKFTQFKNSIPKTNSEGIKLFLYNTASNAIKKLENFAKQGITNAEKAPYKGHVKDLYAKNALKKIIATTVGTGASVVTITTRNKDANNNGIPDKAELKPNTLGVMKDIVENLPTVAAAVNLI